MTRTTVNPSSSSNASSTSFASSDQIRFVKIDKISSSSCGAVSVSVLLVAGSLRFRVSLSAFSFSWFPFRFLALLTLSAGTACRACEWLLWVWWQRLFPVHLDARQHVSALLEQQIMPLGLCRPSSTLCFALFSSVHDNCSLTGQRKPARFKLDTNNANYSVTCQDVIKRDDRISFQRNVKTIPGSVVIVEISLYIYISFQYIQRLADCVVALQYTRRKSFFDSLHSKSFMRPQQRKREVIIEPPFVFITQRLETLSNNNRESVCLLSRKTTDAAYRRRHHIHIH